MSGWVSVEGGWEALAGALNPEYKKTCLSFNKDNEESQEQQELNVKTIQLTDIFHKRNNNKTISECLSIQIITKA